MQWIQSALLILSLWYSTTGEQMPRFVYKHSTKMLLLWNDVWEVGSQNSLVLLDSGSRITIRVRLAGLTSGSGLKRILALTCAGSASIDEIDLDSLTAVPVEYCTTDIPFTLRKSTADDFELRMSNSKITYINVFLYKVTMRVRVQYSGGTLQSNTLSIWNMDPISSFPASSSSPGGFDRHFLTENAISLLTRTNLGSGNFHNIPFIEPNMISTLQSAPDFFKQKLNLGALLNIDSTPCSSVQYDTSISFANYHSKLSLSHMEQMKTMILNRYNGILWYARCHLYRRVSQFYISRGSPPEIGICRSVSVSGDVVPYSKMSDVRTRMTNPAEFSYPGCSGTGNGTCMVVPDVQQSVTIYSGMENTQLVCPIVCDDPTTAFRFYHNDRQLLPPTSSDWGMDRGIRVSRPSNIIELPADVSISQSGVYRCEAGGSSFSYSVSVVSMPSFTLKIGDQSGTVPQRLFAMQGEGLSFSCAVGHSGLSTSVSLQPQFFLPSVSSGVTRWTQYGLDGFNNLVSSGSLPAVSASVSGVGSAGVQLMNVSIQGVPPVQQSFGYNFTHRFVCNASVSGADAANLGMSSYATQSGGDVLFVSRPTRGSFVVDDDNDCVTQKCHLGNGATFRFALSSEYVDYLEDIGVDVVSFFRIDNLLLTDMRLLMQSNVSIINATTYSLVYQLLPIWSPEVRSELQKRSSLTPVFNLRYRNASNMGNVRLLKDRHGAPTVALGPMDCRSDPLCFYSTDFDVPGNLSFLSVKLDFNDPQPPPVAAADMTIMIVIIVVCVVVIILLVVLVTYFATRQPEKTYRLEEKEIEQGHNPQAEANDEKFKDYVHQSGYTPDVQPSDGNGDISLQPTNYQNAGFLESARHSGALDPEDINVESEYAEVERADRV